MTQVPVAQALNRPGRRRIGIVDIGSNSVRLVVYDGSKRTAVPLFNEKVICGLGRALQSTGRLDPEGVEQTLGALARFAVLACALEVDPLDVLATAAVRDAEDGPAFVVAVQDRLGLDVQVLSGRREAHFSALGVLCGIPGAEGLMGDLGGGSLELVSLGVGDIGEGVTLPLGSLRLIESSGDDRDRARSIVDESLAEQSWLDKAAGRRLYLVGGAWRALARIHIAQTDYPIAAVHQYVLPWRVVAALANVLTHQSGRSLEKIAGISPGRLATLPYAALVLRRLMKRTRPEAVVFSAHGLREGWFMSRLDDEVRRQDPLIFNCLDIGERFSRYGGDDGTLTNWTAALFADEDPAEARLRRAACMLSDVAWSEHPEYRAEQAYLRVLRLGIGGMDHGARAFLALSVFVRYGGAPGSAVARPSSVLLDEDTFARALAIGRALRLAYKICGGSFGLLARTRLVLDAERVTLLRPSGEAVYDHHSIERRLRQLADALGREPATADLDAPVAAALS